MKKNFKSRCGCKFGCVGGCCGIIILVLVIFIISLITGGFWIKNRTYLNQPDRINKLADKICDYKLPAEFIPAMGLDYGFVRFALFVWKMLLTFS